MPVPRKSKKTDEISREAKAFAKNANHDAPKQRREPKDTDMPLIAFRVHPDVEYTLEEYQKENRLTWSEFLRDTLMLGMKTKGITIKEKPKTNSEDEE
jgi:hypothetical protein